ARQRHGHRQRRPACQRHQLHLGRRRSAPRPSIGAGMARDFLGIGWKCPLQVAPSGRIAQARYEQRIEESVFLILSTARGERVMVPDFGCGIHDLTFSPNTPGARAAIVDAVRTALVKYEPRIDVLDVETEPQGENLLLIRINYRIRATSAIGTLVYPFYIREAA